MKLKIHTISRVAAIACILTGLAVITGWIFDLPAIKSAFSGNNSMKFNTAVCFILSGVALYLLDDTGISKRKKNFILVCVWLVMLTGLLTIAQYLTGTNFGIDELLWKEGPVPENANAPGRMGFFTALNFSLLALVLLILNNKKFHFFIQVVIIINFTITLLVIFNHLAGVDFLRSIPSQVSATALHTAAVFIILCVGIFFSSHLRYLKFSFQKKIAAFFGLVIFLVVIIFISVHQMNNRSINTSHLVIHSNEVLLANENILRQAEEIETGVRGYIITNDEKFLEPYQKAVAQINLSLSHLRELTKDNASQQTRIDNLDKLVLGSMKLRATLIDLRRKAGFEAVMENVRKGEGKLLTDSIRSVSAAIQQEEDRLLAIRKAENQLVIDSSSRFIMVFQVIAGLILIATFFIIYKNTKSRNKAEMALRKSEEFIKAIINNTSNPISIRDLSGKYILVNKSVARVLKRNENDIIGKDYYELLPKETADAVKGEDEKTIQAKSITGAETSIVLNGDRQYFTTNRFPLFDEQDNVYAVGSVSTDITAIKRAEEQIKQMNLDLEKRVEEKTNELMKAELHFRNILDDLMEGVQIIGFDWRTKYANNMLLQHARYKREEFVGYTIMEKYPGIEQTEIFKAYQRCFDERIPVRFETEFTFPDGIKRWFDISAQPIPEGIFVLTVDITKQKKAVQEKVSLLDTLQKSLNEIYIFKPDTLLFQYVNNGALSNLGYSEEEIKKMTPLDIKPDFTEQLFKELVTPLINGEQKKIVFFTNHQRKNGTLYPVEVHLQLIKQQNHEVFLAVILDITERKKAEEKIIKYTEELKASNTELERFAYVASHDLQEPLRMVSSFLNLLEDEIGGQLNETSKEYINYAVDGAARMKILVNDLLQYSRVGTNKEDFAPTDINEVMVYVKRVLEEEIEKNHAVITVGTLPVITVNKTLISQLFVNLVSNALKYHCENIAPIIEIGCTEAADNYTFFVKDNGIGIDPKFFDKIFIIFQRLHNKNEYSGTGIGLAICKKVVDLHKGKIWVESEQGKGSTFYFTIPKK